MSAGQQALLAAVAASVLPPGVAPTIMSTATLWIKPVDPTTLYKDMSGTNVSANGDDIATARDANGTARLIKALDSAGSMPDYLVADTPAGFDVLSSINSNGTSNSPMSGFVAASAGSGVPTGSALPVSAIITASAMTWSGALYIDNASSLTDYNGDMVWVDGGGFIGLVVASSGLFKAYTWSSGDRYVQVSASLNTWAVVSFKHESGNLKIRLNGGSWATGAAGNTDDVSGALKLFTRYSGAVGRPELKTAGMAWWSTALSDADLLDVEKYFGGLVGVSI